MAGEDPPTPAPAPSRPEAPKVRTLSCPSCGAPLTVRGLLQTESIACGACGSVVDLTDENLQVISTFQARARIQPTIPLGTRGKLLGETLEVIGYMRRKVTVEGIDYEWSEYLLFNPYKGFRWLSEYTGHWTFIRTIHERLPGVMGITYLGRNFQHFQTSIATVTYVLGEFHWRVQAGEKAVIEDCISPPYILSRETTGNEVVWSLGQYLEPSIVAAAFQVKTLPARIGVYSCQPSPLGSATSRFAGVFLRFAVAALVIQSLFLLISANKIVYQGDFVFRPDGGEKSFVTDVFDVPGRVSNLVVRTRADVSNSWIYLNYALINDATGDAYDFGREVSYYFGRDSDGSWTEGRQSDEATLPSVPSGRYYLRIEPEGPDGAVSYSVRLYRDVAHWTVFWLALGALLVPPALVFWRERRFEVQRWAESDHPMITLSSFTSNDD